MTVHVRKKRSFIRDILMNKFNYLLVLPAAIYTFIYGYMTLPYMATAFQRFDYRTGIFNSEWVGVENFRFFFESTRAAIVTWNTIKLNLLFIIVGTLIALALAILLNEIRSKLFKKITQSTFLFPYFLSWIIVSYIIYSLFSTRSGLVNQMVQYFDFERINWYATPGPWTWILVALSVWKGAGMMTVIFLAAITAIDGSLFEAARIDGANRWQQIKTITVPLLIPTVSILTLIAIGQIFYGEFGMIYAIVKDNGLLYPTTDVIDTYVFRALRTTGSPSQAMAVGLYQSMIGFVLVLGFNWLAKKLNPDNAIF